MSDREDLDDRAQDYPGCVNLRRARSTGTVVGLYRTREIDLDTEDPWALICEDHASILTVWTRAIAVSFQPHPEEWCDDCREAYATRKLASDR